MSGSVEVTRRAEISPLAGGPDPKEILVDVADRIRYTLTHRPGWNVNSMAGKTAVSNAEDQDIVDGAPAQAEASA